MKQSGLILAGVALCLVTTALAAKTGPIGGARVIVKQVTGTIGDSETVLRRGDAVFENQLISTGDKARAQFKFIDNTLLTLGERSDIRLDTYVYNPRRKTGRIVINSLKGAFRFVTGSARKASYQIKTPLATIGVRGTTIDGYMDPNGQFSAFILQRGLMTVCSGSACKPVNRVGYYVIVKADGSVSKPKRWTGKVAGFSFASGFPASGGRFYADPSHYDTPGGGSSGEGSSTMGGSGGNSGGYSGGGGYTSGGP